MDFRQIDIRGRRGVGLACVERGFEVGDAALEFAGFEQPGGDAGGPEYGVGAGDGGLHAEEIEGDGLDDAPDAVGGAEAVGEVIGALDGLLAAAPVAAEAPGLGGLLLVDRDGASSRTARRAWGWRGTVERSGMTKAVQERLRVRPSICCSPFEMCCRVAVPPVNASQRATATSI